jgi:hypothetical protein
MNEVNQMLNGTIPTIPSVRCSHCNVWIPDTGTDAPCASCQHAVFLEANDIELLETMRNVPSHLWDKAAHTSWERSGHWMQWGEMVD